MVVVSSMVSVRVAVARATSSNLRFLFLRPAVAGAVAAAAEEEEDEASLETGADERRSRLITAAGVAGENSARLRFLSRAVAVAVATFLALSGDAKLEVVAVDVVVGCWL